MALQDAAGKAGAVALGRPAHSQSPTACKLPRLALATARCPWLWDLVSETPATRLCNQPQRMRRTARHAPHAGLRAQLFNRPLDCALIRGTIPNWAPALCRQLRCGQTDLKPKCAPTDRKQAGPNKQARTSAPGTPSPCPPGAPGWRRAQPAVRGTAWHSVTQRGTAWHSAAVGGGQGQAGGSGRRRRRTPLWGRQHEHPPGRPSMGAAGGRRRGRAGPRLPRAAALAPPGRAGLAPAGTGGS